MNKLSHFNLFLNRYLPALQPEDVADATINAILTDEAVCIVPSHASYAIALRK